MGLDVSARYAPTMGETLIRDQVGCARCGADEHLALEYRPLTDPIEIPTCEGQPPWRWTHWAMCPTNDEPILLCETE